MQNLMGTNPLQAAAFRPAIEAVEAEASKAGRYGSAYQQAASPRLLRRWHTKLSSRRYSRPMARQLGFADLETLAGVGAAREAQQQAELAGDIERFQFEQQAPQVSARELHCSGSGRTDWYAADHTLLQ